MRRNDHLLCVNLYYCTFCTEIYMTVLPCFIYSNENWSFIWGQFEDRLLLSWSVNTHTQTHTHARTHARTHAERKRHAQAHQWWRWKNMRERRENLDILRHKNFLLTKQKYKECILVLIHSLSSPSHSYNNTALLPRSSCAKCYYLAL